MTGNPIESSFMQAAAKNIADLQVQVKTAQKAADHAKASAAAAKREAIRWKKLTVTLVVVVLVALAASGLSIYNWVKAKDATNQLRRQSIALCEAGNQFRSEQVKIWQKDFDLAGINKLPHNSPEYKVALEFINFVYRTDAPQNCHQTFNAQARANG